jgi:hypothetical protein
MQKKYIPLELLYQVGRRLRKPATVEPGRINDPDKAAQLISQMLKRDEPCMIARLGNGELEIVTSYLGQLKYKGFSHLLTFLEGKTPRWWWTDQQVKALNVNAGFFNITDEGMRQFSRLMMDDMREVDILGSWLPEEKLFHDQLGQASRIRLRYLEPFWSATPWTACLEGKHVLVVHPFAQTIEKQYTRRSELFENPNLLPTFASLRTIKAVQSIGNEANGFPTWFDALAWMEKEMDKEDYDVALIGCGAYGFPLAAHAKRTGHKAVHLGGALQLLFGIKGRRWFSPEGDAYKDYHHLLRPSWVSPDDNDRPKQAQQVEGACYW